MTDKDIYENVEKERKLLSTCYKRCFWVAVVMIATVAICYMLTGCTTTKYVPVVEHHTEYVTKTDTFIKRDSIYCQDSTSIHDKGDTVLIEKWHTEYRDRWRETVHTDSFIKRDSIPVPYPVEKKLTKWQQTKLDWGGEAIIALIVFMFIIIWLIIKRMQQRQHNE